MYIFLSPDSGREEKNCRLSEKKCLATYPYDYSFCPLKLEKEQNVFYSIVS